MSEICVEVVKITTTGNNGSATGTGTSGPMNGWLEDVYLDYHASAPASTDVTIAFGNRGGNILYVENNATDGLYVPRAGPVSNANAAITNAHARFALAGEVTVTVGGSNALTDCVAAYLKYERA